MNTLDHKIQSALTQAESGHDINGHIDCGGAYIAYETITVDGERYFTLEVNSDTAHFGDACSRPVAQTREIPLRLAQSAALRVLDDPREPESDELNAVIEL